MGRKRFQWPEDVIKREALFPRRVSLKMGSGLAGGGKTWFGRMAASRDPTSGKSLARQRTTQHGNSPCALWKLDSQPSTVQLTGRGQQPPSQSSPDAGMQLSCANTNLVP